MTEQSQSNNSRVFEPDINNSILNYLTILFEHNKTTNLTAITDWDEAIVKHLHDSLAIGMWKEAEGARSILDLGSGAGIPGIPLALYYPKKEVFLLEANTKKKRFIEFAIEELKLSNCTVLHGRAEDLGRKDEFREKFDIVATRAVAKLAVLLELSFPFIKIGGHLVAYKGPSINDEISQAKAAICELRANDPLVINYSLKEQRGERNLLILKKKGYTPLKYPRRAGIPEKKPL